MERPDMKMTCVRIMVLVLSALLWWSMGCSGKVHDGTLEGNLLDYDKAEPVSFVVSGDATCSTCGPAENFVGMQVEIYLKSDPTQDLAIKMFDGLGHFEVQNLRTYKGAPTVIEGRLYWNDSINTPPLTARAEFTVPDNDGDTVSVTLDFSSDH